MAIKRRNKSSPTFLRNLPIGVLYLAPDKGMICSVDAAARGLHNGVANPLQQEELLLAAEESLNVHHDAVSHSQILLVEVRAWSEAVLHCIIT